MEIRGEVCKVMVFTFKGNDVPAEYLGLVEVTATPDKDGIVELMLDVPCDVRKGQQLFIDLRPDDWRRLVRTAKGNI